MEESLTKKVALNMKRYETSKEVLRLIKFADWAQQRGGDDAFNESNPKNALTHEEKEMNKPFWERTYIVASQPFKFDRKFINDYMKRADFLIKDNESSYRDYKKRALFPKISENKHKDDAGEELGFIE